MTLKRKQDGPPGPAVFICLRCMTQLREGTVAELHRLLREKGGEQKPTIILPPW